MYRLTKPNHHCSPATENGSIVLIRLASAEQVHIFLWRWLGSTTIENIEICLRSTTLQKPIELYSSSPMTAICLCSLTGIVTHTTPLGDLLMHRISAQTWTGITSEYLSRHMVQQVLLCVSLFICVTEALGILLLQSSRCWESLVERSPRCCCSSRQLPCPFEGRTCGAWRRQLVAVEDANFDVRQAQILRCLGKSSIKLCFRTRDFLSISSKFAPSLL